MDEKELRQYWVDTCCSYMGYNEADGSHKTIINMYNSIQPLPVNYRMSYADPWCAAYVSAMAWKCKLTDIIFPECGCDRMIELYKRAGRWQERDDYTPDLGDLVLYDWQDSGKGDNTGSADHIGVVVSVSGLTIKIVEGNISNKVGYRNLIVDGKYIRGYCLPDFAKKVGAKDINAPVTEKVTDAGECEVTLPVLRKGDTGNSVRAAQLLLIGNNCSCGPDGADGELGNNTRSAILDFRRKKGLSTDGIVDKDTWSALLK